MAKKAANKKTLKPATVKTPPSALVPMPEPAAPPQIRADHVFPGRPVPPIQRVKLFSAAEWEEFIQEWAHSLKKKYHTVMRCSGAGDMGRDVVAHTGLITAQLPWDNYQCKHYDHALRPSDIWVELGKLAYYTFLGAYSIPRQYFFVCPHDVGTSLARLFETSENLRTGLKDNWDTHCLNGICSIELKLDGKLKDHVEAFPFDRVSFIPVLKIIEEHQATPWFVHRFGGGLPNRPPATTPPCLPTTNEVPYISALFEAYTDHKGAVVDQAALHQFPQLEKHFKVTRTSFYSAESLEAFSRDHLPENEYGRLQAMIHDGVQETYLDSHKDGFAKVLEVAKSAIQVQITDHALVPVLTPPDRRGICHQLVNDGQFTWVG